MSGWLYALGGGLAGAAQAGLLSRQAQGFSGMFSFLARLILVAAVLFLAARAGHLPLGAAGWVLGFATGVAVVHRWLR